MKTNKIYSIVTVVATLVGILWVLPSCERREIEADFAELDVRMANNGIFYIGGNLEIEILSKHSSVKVVDFKITHSTQTFDENFAVNSVISIKGEGVSEPVAVLKNITSSALNDGISEGRLFIKLEDPDTGFMKEKTLAYRIFPEQSYYFSVNNQREEEGISLRTDEDICIVFNPEDNQNKPYKLILDGIQCDWFDNIPAIVYESGEIIFNKETNQGTLMIDKAHFNLGNFIKPDTDDCKMTIFFHNPDVPNKSEAHTFNFMITRHLECLLTVDNVQHNKDLKITLYTLYPSITVDLSEWKREENISFNSIRINDNEEPTNDNISRLYSNSDTEGPNHTYKHTFILEKYVCDDPSQSRQRNIYMTVIENMYNTSIQCNGVYMEESSSIPNMETCKINKGKNFHENDKEKWIVDAYEDINDDDQNYIEIILPSENEYLIRQSGDGAVRWYCSSDPVYQNGESVADKIKSLVSNKKFNNTEKVFGKYLYVIGDNNNDKNPGGNGELKIVYPHTDPAPSKTIYFYSRYSIGILFSGKIYNRVPNWPYTNENHETSAEARNDKKRNGDYWWQMPSEMTITLQNAGKYSITSQSTTAPNLKPITSTDILINSLSIKNIANRDSKKSPRFAAADETKIQSYINSWANPLPRSNPYHRWEDKGGTRDYAMSQLKTAEFTGSIDGTNENIIETVSAISSQTVKLQKTTKFCWMWDDVYTFTYLRGNRYYYDYKTEWKKFIVYIDNINEDKHKCVIKYAIHGYYSQSPWWESSDISDINSIIWFNKKIGIQNFTSTSE